MDLEKRILPNGAKMLYYKNSALHSAAACLKVGAANRVSFDDFFLCHVLEHLCFNGCGKMSEKQLYEYFDNKGVFVDASTWFDYIDFPYECRPEDLAEILDKIYSMTMLTEWSERSLEKEKQVICSEIDQCETDGRYSLCFRETVQKYIGLPSVAGTKKQVCDCNLTMLKQVRDNLFVGGNLTLVLAGNLSDGQLDACAEVLSRFPERESKVFNLELPNFKPKRFYRESDGEFANVVYNFVCDQSDFYAARLISDILGAGDNSVFDECLRQNRVFAYDWDSGCQPCGAGKAVLYLGFFINKEDLSDFLPLADDVLFGNDYSHKLSHTLPYMKNEMLFDLDKPAQIIEEYNNVDCENPQQAKKDFFYSVTKENFSELYKKIVNRKNCVFYLYGGEDD